MNQELSDQQLAAALRAKAQKYLKMAEELDGKSVTSIAVQTRAPSPIFYGGSSESEPTADAVKKLIQEGQKLRVKGIAAHFKCSPDAIKRIVDNPSNGLTDKDRGWVKLSS